MNKVELLVLKDVLKQSAKLIFTLMTITVLICVVICLDDLINLSTARRAKRELMAMYYHIRLNEREDIFKIKIERFLKKSPNLMKDSYITKRGKDYYVMSREAWEGDWGLKICIREGKVRGIEFIVIGEKDNRMRPRGAPVERGVCNNEKRKW